MQRVPHALKRRCGREAGVGGDLLGVSHRPVERRALVLHRRRQTAAAAQLGLAQPLAGGE